ncbi:hypothetical protein BK135_08815, partial [Paenibacillus peoriae]
FETDEIKYLLFDFANKIVLLTRCSVFKDQTFFFVDLAHCLINSYIISCPNQLCKHFLKSFFVTLARDIVFLGRN